jgi:tetratricopeptide (TPR) repeat protein
LDGDRVDALVLVEQLQPALRRDDRATIVNILGQLVALRAPMGGQWRQLAQIAAANGEIGLARAALRLFVENADGSARARYHEAAALADIGLWGDVHAALQALPPNTPDPAAYAYSRGTAALHVGEIDEARRLLEEALNLRPRSAATWLSLATLIDFADEPELTRRIIASQAGMQLCAPAERATFLHALGKAFADLGDPAPAFGAFAEGARLMRGEVAYDRERDRFTAHDAVDGYDPGRIAELAGRQDQPTDRTIFLMGLPRSGTTLVEQILTSHSAVAAGGEISRLGLFIKDVGGLSRAALKKYVDAGRAPEAARLWDHWLSELFGAAGRIVDKTTNTTRLLGYAAALLPEAPLIWLTRDPLDRAWSCFRTKFVAGQPWSYDLEDIAYHFRLEDQLLARWQDHLGDRLLVVPYEALASEPEAWTRRILAHCGLPEEQQVFTPHNNPRAVSTSSVMQVRRPIGRGAIGSAEPYRQFLAPFVNAYWD